MPYHTVYAKWKLIQGITSVDSPFQQYKPNVDHTYGETAKTCRFSFWYWWSGPESGSLHVLVKPSVGNTYEAWMVDGNLGNQWQLAEVGLGELSMVFISLQAHRGIRYEGGGAVDDLSFIECATPGFPPNGLTCKDLGQYQCSSGACVTNSSVCDYSDDCLDYSDEAARVPGGFLCVPLPLLGMD
nr:MAM and LDL-receptor class A domain-containing protein 1-like [Cherax quadricarinatus]